MCPSYMATREEEHSTRGRARLLFEMLEGKPLNQAWREKAVHDALDLCLACKGCKSECPVNVDMASYKAEFLSHYYSGRIRPPQAYSMGLIYWWAGIAARAPGIANALANGPLTSGALHLAGGISSKRDVPRLAPSTFKAQHRAAQSSASQQNGGRKEAEPRKKRGHILLWPDTFNNHFLPQTLSAATEVLESVGFAVHIPHRNLCCGRPLYDFGMLALAKRLLAQILGDLRREIRVGIPLVVLEPSCASVFKDELLQLFPDDGDARRLAAQTFLLDEFLERYASDQPWQRLNRTAHVQTHCHQRALSGTDDETSALNKAGVEVTRLSSGCCGMAGAFGFSRDHYDVSMAVAEQGLGPNLRRVDDNALIVADGFSCREQIRHLTGREPLHIAEVLKMAVQSPST